LTDPAVSVVIPTCARPSLVLRAVRSVLAQSVQHLEIVVVLDGADSATETALRTVEDHRIRVEVLPEPRGPAGARNAGVRAARAELIAFLDDDDEWHPDKLRIQLDERSPGDALTISAARVVARRPGHRDRVWPTRLPDPGEPLGDYLLARRGLRWGETLVHTSTIVATTELLRIVPFREDVRHEDYDWLLRAGNAGAAVAFVHADEPLATWHIDNGRPRHSRRSDPAASLAWIRSVRGLVSRRAYAAFLLTWVVPDARGLERLRLMPQLLWEAARAGSPAPVHVAVAVGSALVPARLRS
jgi:glycosyltransferase involved in cell wall biosynthesis